MRRRAGKGAAARRAVRQLGSSAAALALLLAGCGSTTYSGISDETAPAAAEFPPASGTLTDVYEAADGESKLVDPADRHGLRQGHRPLRLRRLHRRPKSRSPTPRSRSTSPTAKTARPRAPTRLGSNRWRPSRPSSPRRPARTRRRPRSSTSPTGAPFSADGEWRALAMVAEGGKLEATLLPSAVVGHFKQARPGVPEEHREPAGRRREGSRRPHPDRGRRRRRPGQDRHPDPARRHARRPRQGARAANRSCSSSRRRSSARAGSAGRWSTRRSRSSSATATGSPSSTWRSTTKTTRRRGCGPRSAAFRLPSEPWTFVIDRDGDRPQPLRGRPERQGNGSGHRGRGLMRAGESR